MAKMLANNGLSAHATTIAKIEAGDRQVRIDEAAAIADLFDVSLDSLLGRKTALENDLVHAVRSLQEVAHKALWDIGHTMDSVRERVADVADFDFEGRDALESELSRAFGATEEAQDALYAVAGFELPPKAAVRLREELITNAAYEALGKLLKEVDEKGQEG